MPLRTSLMSAPTRSQIFAISLIKLIFVASIQFAAYLIISALSMPTEMNGFSVRRNGLYSSSRISAAAGSSTPTTTRSGFVKSSIAAPSLRNSGFDAMLNVVSVFALIHAATRRFVPTGTVLLQTTTVLAFRYGAIFSAALCTNRRSAAPDSSCGVPTQMKIHCAVEMASW